MDKPISIMMKELKSKIISDVNESGLPVTISAIILSEVMQECRSVEQELENNYLQEESKNELC